MPKVLEFKLCEGGNRADDRGVCDADECKFCCEHGDRDSHCCLICGTEIDWSDFYNEDHGRDR